ncbi:MAG: class I SAM-dependent methyltransferase family protein [Candidatus Omnitrophota bacterium]
MRIDSFRKAIAKECLKGSAVFQDNLESYLELLEKMNLGGNFESFKCKFSKATDRLLKSADEFALKQKSKKSVHLIKECFREVISPFATKGLIVKRGYEKPRGYPGDYLTLEMIYDLKSLSTDILGRLFDQYLLEDSYVVAIRNRKEMMKGLVKKAIIQSSSKKMRILNIASGGARDIRELFIEDFKLDNLQNVEFVLVDQDKAALDFSKQEIDLIGPSLNVRYVHERIEKVFRKQKQFISSLGAFDMIYSIGLIDYIPDLLLGELVKFCFEILNPSGELVLSVKNTKKFRSLASDWFCDWNFYLREQKDLIRIIDQSLYGRNFKVKPIKGLDDYISFVSVIRKK